MAFIASHWYVWLIVVIVVYIIDRFLKNDLETGNGDRRWIWFLRFLTLGVCCISDILLFASVIAIVAAKVSAN